MQNRNSYPRCILVLILVQHTKPQTFLTNTEPSEFFFSSKEAWIVKMQQFITLTYSKLLQVHEVLAFST